MRHGLTVHFASETSRPGDTLIHYASEYYDPVKAHEYYEKHKKLKGRQGSTSGLNEEGRDAARYIKNKLEEERKSKDSTERENMQSKVSANKEQLKAELQSHTSKTKLQIATLRAKIDKMSGAEKLKNEQAIYDQINSLRDANAAERSKLQSAYSSHNEGLKSEYKNKSESLKTEYDNKYVDELEKLKAQPEFQKSKSGSKKKISYHNKEPKVIKTKSKNTKGKTKTKSESTKSN